MSTSADQPEIHRIVPTDGFPIPVEELQTWPKERTLAERGEWITELYLVPEPDNPRRERAISVRRDNLLVGYLPADSGWWEHICRIVASHKFAVVVGRFSATADDFALDLSLGNPAEDPTEGLIPAAPEGYRVPDAYGETDDPATVTLMMNQVNSSTRVGMDNGCSFGLLLFVLAVAAAIILVSVI